jgi:hypothetical protein
MKLNYELLISLHLSRVEFIIAKCMAKCCETLAKQKQQLHFIRRCINAGIYTPTVDGIHLPQCFKDRVNQNAVRNIKDIIMKTLQRHLQRSIGILLSRKQSIIEELQQLNCERTKSDIERLAYVSFGNSQAYHMTRLSKRFNYLLWKRYRHQVQNRTHEMDIPLDFNHLVSDLTNSLSHEEKALLSKGPKYKVSRHLDYNSMLDIRTSFCRMAYHLRWQQVLAQKPDTPGLQPFPKSTDLSNPPVAEIELQNKLTNAYRRIQTTLKSTMKRKAKINLNESEQSILKQLKTKPMVFLPSDKGGEFCVINKPQYIELASQHLSDISIYKEIRHITPATIEEKINSKWKEICNANSIPSHITKSYVSRNTSLPRFYHLIKTHKPGPELKVRPIISNTNGPMAKLSWLISRLMKPLLQTVPAHLEASSILIQRIQDMNNDDRKKYSYPCSLDVVSLYTVIPPNEAIQNAREVMLRNNFVLPGIDIQDVCDLLGIILQNTYFSFGDKIFIQIEGLAMGSSISGILAILFMDTIEKRALFSFRRTGLYVRYVDDICALVENREDAEELHTVMNAQHPKLRFELEHPDADGCLALLDLRMNLADGTPTFEFYRKKAKKEIFINAKSAVPPSAKESIIRNEISRIQQHCSTTEISEKHLNSFQNMLVKNGYGMNTTQKVLNKANNTSSRTINKLTTFFEMPFISDHLHKRITRIFREEGLDVLVYNKNKSLRQLLSPQFTNSKACTLASCPIMNSKLCFQKNVIYQIQCSICNQVYVGSTIRELHIRAREHLQRPNSAVFKHLSHCNTQTIKAKILSRDTDPKNLRLREAIIIRDMNPSINIREEEKCLLALVDPVRQP